MFFQLFLLFTLIPILELALLLRVGNLLGWQATLGIVILTGAIGAWLARQQGIRTLGRMQQEIEAGNMPADQIVDGVMILVAGVLLITPGILTDLVGFSLLIPPMRGLIRKHVGRRIRRKITVVRFGGPAGANEPADVIDVEARDVSKQRD